LQSRNLETIFFYHWIHNSKIEALDKFSFEKRYENWQVFLAMTLMSMFTTQCFYVNIDVTLDILIDIKILNYKH